MLTETSEGYWVKIKPEYFGEQSDSLDLLVLGGYYASGRRRSTLISHFLLGTRINTSVCNDSLEDGQFFHTVCKVGTGYSVSELQDWNQLLKKATFKTAFLEADIEDETGTLVATAQSVAKLSRQPTDA